MSQLSSIESLTPEREVGGLMPCCVLEQDTFTPKKVLVVLKAVAPFWYDLKIVNWELSINTNKKQELSCNKKLICKG